MIVPSRWSRAVRAVAFASVCTVSAVACDGYGHAYEPTPANVPVQGIRVTPQTVHFGTRGETRQLFVAVTPINATDPSLVWETSDSTVATVNATGLVTALGAGVDVLITAHTRDRRFESSSNVSVEP